MSNKSSGTTGNKQLIEEEKKKKKVMANSIESVLTSDSDNSDLVRGGDCVLR